MPRRTWRSTIGDGSRTSGFKERLETTLAGFLDLAEAAKKYPLIKTAWVEFLGERPDPVFDRVE